MNGLWSAQWYLLSAITGVLQVTRRVSPVARTRNLVVATIGFVVIVALPVIAVYYARKRWRP